MSIITTSLVFFTLPFGSTLKSIFLIISIVSTVLYYQKQIGRALQHPWCITAGLFFLLILFGLFFEQASSQIQWEVVHKYSKILLLPFFAVALSSEKARSYAVHLFLAAMALTVIGTLLKKFGWCIGEQEADGLFYNHVVTGYFMAFAAFLAAKEMMQRQEKLRYALLFTLFVYDLFFINLGRTGYLMYFILLGVLSVYCIKQRWFIALLLAMTCVFILGSSNALHRLAEGVHNIQDTISGRDSNNSFGIRLQLHQYSQMLVQHHLLLGKGTGAFAQEFAKDNPLPQWSSDARQPHGEYWHIVAEHGIVGLAMFFWFLFELFKVIPKLHETKVMYTGILVTFVVGCLFDGFLLVPGTGYFFILFTALGLGELLS